jgi:hypothetical protein
MQVLAWGDVPDSTRQPRDTESVRRFLYETEQSIETGELAVPHSQMRISTRRSIDRSVSQLALKVGTLVQSADEVMIVNGRTRVGALVTTACREAGKTFHVLEVGSDMSTWTQWTNTYPQDESENERRMWHAWHSADEAARKDAAEKFLDNRYAGAPLQGWKFQPETHDQKKLNELLTHISTEYPKGFVVFYPTSGVEFSVTKPDERSATGADQAHAFISLCQAAEAAGLGVIVRVHPQPWGSRVRVENEIWAERAKPHGAVVVPAESSINSYELAKVAYATATHSSSIGPELLGMGVRSLVLGSPYWAKLMGPLHATTSDEVLDALSTNEMPACDAVHPWAYYMSQRGVPYEFVEVGGPGMVTANGSHVDHLRGSVALARVVTDRARKLARVALKMIRPS